MALYNICIEILTPVHIGADETKNLAPNIDYIHFEDTIYVLDQNKLYKHFDINKLVNLILKGKLADELINLGLQNFAKQTFYYPYRTGNQDILVQVRNPLTNKPIIPGSSLKGAIRTVLLNHFIKQTGFKPNNISKPSDINKLYELFGTLQYSNDFMRFIKVPDIEFNETDLFPVKTFSIDEAGKGAWKNRFKNATTQEFDKNAFVIPVEAINIGDKAEAKIKFEKEYFDLFNKFAEREAQKPKPKFRPTPEHTKEIMQNDPWKKFCQIANSYISSYIQKEIEYHQKYAGAENEDIILDFYKWLFKQIPQDDTACLLRLGYGLGFHAITGDWLYEKHTKTGEWEPRDPEFSKFGIKPPQQKNLIGKPRWKTRKFIIYEYVDENDEEKLDLPPFGYIRLKLIK